MRSPRAARALVGVALCAAVTASDSAYSSDACPPPNAPPDAPTGGGPRLNPTTGGDATTGGGGGGAGPTTPGLGFLPGRRGDRVDDLPPATTDPASSLHSWVRWWERNKEAAIRYAERVRRDACAATPGGEATAETEQVREEQDSLVRDSLVPVFLQAFTDDDATVRVSAAMALGRSGDAAASKPLRRAALDDRHPLVRETALLALGLLRRPIDVPFLADRFGDRRLESRSRAFAAISLGLIGGEDAADVLAGHVAKLEKGHSSREDFDCATVLSLGLTETEGAARSLLALAQDVRFADTLRAASMVALARMGEKRAAFPALIGLQRDKHGEMRSASALALGRLGSADDDGTVDLLVEAAREDASPAVRHFAMLSLGRLGGAEVGDRLQVLFARAKGDDRLFAALALGFSHHAPAGRVLRDAFEEERSDNERSALAIALGLHGDAKAVPLLRKSLDGRRTQWHQAYAATALAMLGDRASAETIRERLFECRDEDVRRHLAVALGLLGDEAAADLLAKILDRDPSREDRGAAAMALGLLRATEKVPLLVATARSRGEHATVRACAVSALAQIADPLPVPRLARLVADDDYTLGIEPIDRAWSLLHRR